MLRSLYGKLALAMMAVFVASGAVFIVVGEQMPGAYRLLELASGLLIGAMVSSFIAALIVFNLMTRRLRVLVAALEAFRPDADKAPLRLPLACAQGDEIDRLGAAFAEMAERMAKQLDQLKRNDEQRRELLANVSHDLRTPMACMQGYLQTLLLRHATLSAAEQRQYLEVAVKNCERLEKRVRDLFELTKLEAREVGLKEEEFALGELAQDVVQKFQTCAERHGLRLLHQHDGVLPAVRADIGLIERVLENLIENAMRHTPENGIIRLELAPAGNRVALRVSDTGLGIAREELPRIFERYFRGSGDEFQSDGGAGLGLAISRRIVELHGGQLEVDSTLGVGTRFRFDLPAAALATPEH